MNINLKNLLPAIKKIRIQQTLTRSPNEAQRACPKALGRMPTRPRGPDLLREPRAWAEPNEVAGAFGAGQRNGVWRQLFCFAELVKFKRYLVRCIIFIKYYEHRIPYITFIKFYELLNIINVLVKQFGLFMFKISFKLI